LPMIRIMTRSLAAIVLSATLFAATISLAQPPQTQSDIDKPAIYQVGEYLHINASGPRPLLQAIEGLQQKYGWAIDYEDPQYLIAQENPAARTSPPHRLNSMARTGNAAGGGFSLRFQLTGPSGAAPAQDKLLAAVVDAYNQSNGAAEFKLLPQAGGRFAVVGVGARDASGSLVSQQPILDAPITLPSAQGTVVETISSICGQLSSQNKTPIAVHIDPALSQSMPAMIAGQTLPARKILSRAVATWGNKTYWQLLYDAQIKSYELNIRRGRAGL
jgi:hypothetical protein